MHPHPSFDEDRDRTGFGPENLTRTDCGMAVWAISSCLCIGASSLVYDLTASFSRSWKATPGFQFTY